MDISKQYIKMCDCEEVQGQWKPRDGDFYKIGIHLCVLPQAHKKCRGCYCEVNEIREECTWLPRQDQLQEMFSCHMAPYLSDYLLTIFYHSGRDDRDWWVLNYKDITSQKVGFVFGNTWEQFWLAFYMKEKHAKQWDGGEELWKS